MSRWSIRFALVLLLLAVAVALALTAAWMTLPLDGTTITIDGESFPLAPLRDDNIVAALWSRAPPLRHPLSLWERTRVRV